MSSLMLVSRRPEPPDFRAILSRFSFLFSQIAHSSRFFFFFLHLCQALFLSLTSHSSTSLFAEVPELNFRNLDSHFLESELPFWPCCVDLCLLCSHLTSQACKDGNCEKEAQKRLGKTAATYASIFQKIRQERIR